MKAIIYHITGYVSWMR